MIHKVHHSYATSPTLLNRFIGVYREWIEEGLGIGLADAVILKTTDLSFHNAALPRLVGYADRYAEVTPPMARLAERLLSVEFPPLHAPQIELTRKRAVGASLKKIGYKAEESCAYSMSLVDCPVLLRVRDLSVPIVALSVKYHPGPNSTNEDEQDLVVISRAGVADFISLLKTLTTTDRRPRLIGGHEDQIIGNCDWDQLVLDPSIVSLLKDDFESFFQREDWFRKMRLPYRRGYLLHGPPGNGKSTAIRAMLSSQGLTAYTIRLFRDKTDDDDLERLFGRAAGNAPAVVLLEDIDRGFPRTGQSKTKVSLQALLNCLDGVASGEGIITIATANEPTALDPAILRRPGRFDRVICFANPTPELRRRYFVNMHPPFAEVNLDAAVEESAGFSFAQLREAYIMAAQAGFVKEREIEIEDLLNSVWSLRSSVLFGAMKASAGFTPLPAAERGVSNARASRNSQD